MDYIHMHVRRFQGNPETRLDIAVVDLSVYTQPLFRQLLLDLDAPVLVYGAPLSYFRCPDESSSVSATTPFDSLPVFSVTAEPDLVSSDPSPDAIHDIPDLTTLESSNATKLEPSVHTVSESPNLTIQRSFDVTSEEPLDFSTSEPRYTSGLDTSVVYTSQPPNQTAVENHETATSKSLDFQTNETVHLSDSTVTDPIASLSPNVTSMPPPNVITVKLPDFTITDLSILPTANSKYCLTLEIPELPNRWEVLVSVSLATSVRSVIILYDNDTESEAVRVSDHLATRETLIRSINVERDVNVSSVYEDVASQFASRSLFLVLCSESFIPQILTTASEFDGPNMRNYALSWHSLWLLVLPPGRQAMVEEIDITLDNVAVVIYPSATPDQQVSVEQGLRQVFTAADTTLLSTANTSVEATFMDLLFKTLDWRSARWKSDVYTLMWESGARRFRHVGHVDQSGCLNLYFPLFPNKDFGFNGRNLLVATLPWEPYVLRESAENETYVYKGFCIDVLEKMAFVLNFTYTLMEPEEKNWGMQVNGSWTGPVGLLERREVDLVMAPIASLPEREEVMDFTFSFSMDSVVMVIKQPDPALQKWRTFIQPFRMEVHLLLWLCLGLMSVLLASTESFNPFYLKQRPRSATEMQILKGEAFWCLYGPMVMQGGEKLPQSHTGRVLVVCWCFFVVVITAAYSGNLVAFLTVTKDVLPFETLEEMIQQPEYVFGVPGGTSYQIMLQTSRVPTHQALWKKIETFESQGLDVLNPDLNVHLRRVLQGKYGVVTDKTGVDNWLNRECDLRVVPEAFFALRYAMGLPDRSPHLDLFSNKMLWMHESGLTEAWRRRWWTNQKFCKGDLVSQAAAITVVDVQSAFYLLVIGLVGAGIVLVGERVLRRWRQRRRRDLMPGSEVAHSATSARRDGELPARQFPLLRLPYSPHPLRQVPFRQQFGRSTPDVAATSPTRLEMTTSGQSDTFIY